MGSLARYVLARWVTAGSDSLLEAGPTAIERMRRAVAEAEDADTDGAPLAAGEDWLDAERLAARGQTIFIWQTLTPVLTWRDNHWGWVIQGCTNHVCFAGLDDSSYGLWNGSCEFLVKCEPAVPPSWDHVVEDPVAKRFIDQVFTASSTTCLESAWDSTCDLGVSQADLFLGRNGWSYACAVKIGETTGAWGGKEWCDRLYEEAATYGSP